MLFFNEDDFLLDEDEKITYDEAWNNLEVSDEKTKKDQEAHPDRDDYLPSSRIDLIRDDFEKELKEPSPMNIKYANDGDKKYANFYDKNSYFYGVNNSADYSTQSDANPNDDRKYLKSTPAKHNKYQMTKNDHIDMNNIVDISSRYKNYLVDESFEITGNLYNDRADRLKEKAKSNGKHYYPFALNNESFNGFIDRYINNIKKFSSKRKLCEALSRDEAFLNEALDNKNYIDEQKEYLQASYYMIKELRESNS